MNTSQPGLTTPQRKRDASGRLNQSLIVQSSAQSQPQLTSAKPVLKKKKAVIVTKRVVKKRVPSGLAAQAANAANLSAQATPDRRTHMTTRSGGLTKTQSSDGRTPKSPSSQFKSSAIRPAHNKNNSSLLSFSSEPGGLKNQRQASVPMLRKETPKVVSKKRVGTPIKLKHSYLKDEVNASYLEDLNKEIAALREKRLQHSTLHQRINDEDEDDDFETAIFAETLLGELGSS